MFCVTANRMAANKALRQIAFYGKGIGKPKRKPEPGVMFSDSSDHRSDAMPFGGFKYDGMDREGVWFASEDMTQPKVVCINRLKTQRRACSNPSTNQGAKNV